MVTATRGSADYELLPRTTGGRAEVDPEAAELIVERRSFPNPVQLGSSALSGVLGVARDPRTIGLLRAGPRVGLFLARSRRRSAAARLDDSIVTMRPSPAVVLQAYLDEALIALFRHPELVPDDDDFVPAAADLGSARKLFATRGWLDRPASYHCEPDAPRDVRALHGRAPGLGYERTTFSSGFGIDRDEPGRDRWLNHEANRTVHGWISRAPGRRHSSWLVCVHGFGMGSNPFMDLRAFRTPDLHRRGINVAVPVLPLHGPRATGRVRGEDFMTIDMVDSMHGIAQAAWDVRRLIRWLRESQGAEKVGLLGYSLGSLVATLVASLEEDLACVIAGIPVVDLPDLFRRHSTGHVARLAAEHGILGDPADDVHRVVSPLAMDCKVPCERRYIFAGLADRMSTFGQARRLWLHWGRPALAAYAGGHVGFFWSRTVRQFVDDAVDASLGPSSSS
jgi:pimeloyl-ACP methyl ester carboxylesterase